VQAAALEVWTDREPLTPSTARKHWGFQERMDSFLASTEALGESPRSQLILGLPAFHESLNYHVEDRRQPSNAVNTSIPKNTATQWHGAFLTGSVDSTRGITPS